MSNFVFRREIGLFLFNVTEQKLDEFLVAFFYQSINLVLSDDQQLIILLQKLY